MFHKIKKIYRPEIFQGSGKFKNYFEGWYFKLVDKPGRTVFSVIPGVSISNKNGSSHSFIQIINGIDAKAEYLKFAFSDFSCLKDRFQIRIKDNFFSTNRIRLDINTSSKKIEADINFLNIKPWPKSFLFPGAMGWYAFMPMMECYHGVVSMDHNIDGYFNYGSQSVDFTGGRGYIEKDWGISFPKGWIWLQTNHFNNTGLTREPASLMLSIARIPWRGRHFNGFICGFLNNSKFYIFATYNGSKIRKLRYSSKDIHAVIENKYHKIIISARRCNSATLHSPIMGAMDGRIAESIDATISVKLSRKAERGRKELIFDSTGSCGGLEIVNPEVLK